MCCSTRWMLNWLEDDQVLHHLYFHTSKVGILQAINHVLVYCFGLNAFYTPFVADFNLITNHPYVYLSLLWWTQKWKDERGKRKEAFASVTLVIFETRDIKQVSHLGFFLNKLTIISIYKHILVLTAKHLHFTWKHCQFSETKSFCSEGPVSWDGVYPLRVTIVNCHWTHQVKTGGTIKYILKNWILPLFSFLPTTVDICYY